MNMCDCKIEDTYSFLIRSAIPEVYEAKSRPSSLPVSSNLLWDCIFRAHRDVLTGRCYLYNYCNVKVDGNVKKDGHYKINAITVDLYNRLVSGSSYVPRDIITELYKKYENEEDPLKSVELGAIQKLVNMTFKYLYLLKIYNVTEESIDKVSFELENCDCPLDSRILSKTENYQKVKWTTDINSIEFYKSIQDEIGRLSKNHLKLLFDFQNYQELTIGLNIQ